MAKKSAAPIYWRNGRAYLDARAYAYVGGGQERLVPAGERVPTRDPIIARELAARRIKELETLRRRKAIHGMMLQTTLGAYAEYHLVEKARAGDGSEEWLAQAERHLNAALEFFGDCDLEAITVPRVQQYAGFVAAIKSRARSLGPGTRRHYLNSLSNLFRRAAGEGYVPPGWNPVVALMHKPKARSVEAR